MPEQTLPARRPSSLKDRIDLRVQMQDAVYEFTRLRREELWRELTEKHQDWDQERVQREVDRLQPEYQEYDPVVQLAIIAADGRSSVDQRISAAGRAAEYVRPKLKSVEVTVGEHDPEVQQQKRELIGRLAEFLNAGAGAKRATVIDVTPNAAAPSPPSSADEEELERPGGDEDADDEAEGSER